MKKIIVVFALLLSLVAGAQDFPGKRPDLLVGKELKVKPIELSKNVKGYERFFSDEKLYDNYLKKGEYDRFTAPELLEGRVFRVLAVDPDPSGYDAVARLKLVDETKGETIFYRYSKDLAMYFDFEVIGGLTYPADYYCEYVGPDKENLEGQIKFVTSPKDGIVFIKIKKGSVTLYLMKINIRSNEQPKGKGVVVTLSNNKLISKPNAKTVTEPMDKNGSYFSTAVFELSLEDTKLLIDNSITKVKVMQAEDPVKQGAFLKGMFGCLITK